MYTVREGDTLFGIARGGGVEYRELLELNPALEASPNALALGQRIIVPNGAGSGAPAGLPAAAGVGLLLAGALWFARSALSSLDRMSAARKVEGAAAEAAGARRYAEVSGRFADVMGGDRQGRELGEDGVSKDDDDNDDDDDDGPGATPEELAKFYADGEFPDLKNFLSGKAADGSVSRPKYYTRRDS
jgi:murein DD-endopeptidase MepM/ murein hydrolase activator NlpD